MDALRDEIRHLDTSPRALRQFGVLVGGVALAVAAWAVWQRGGEVGGWPVIVAAVGGALVFGGTAAPRWLRAPYLVWMGLAVVLGFVTSRVLLTLVFCFVVVPTGLALRASGKTPLAVRPDPGAETYWHARDVAPPDPARFGRYY